ncbi:SGNH/GDSL hydrolase family protein [Lysobacter terrae]
MDAANSGSTLSYLALGDSYTIGEAVAADGRWPVQLARALRAQGIAVGDPRIIAATGWTTDELEWGIDAAEPLGTYDFVSLLIGVNNQYRNRSAVGYAGEFHTLLLRAIQHAGGHANRVLVLSIPDWGITPFAANDKRDAATIGSEVDAFNTAARAQCEREGVAFVDITPISRERGAQAEMIAEDGLHPSAAMYTLWTQAALPVAQKLLVR